MAFEEQTLGAFLDARSATTELLLERGVVKKEITFTEAVVMQAASHMISAYGSFLRSDIARLTDIYPKPLFDYLEKFEETYSVIAGRSQYPDGESQTRRRQSRIYLPTDFGKRVFGLFTPESEERAI